MKEPNEDFPLDEQIPVMKGNTYEQKHAQLLSDKLEPEGLRKILDNPVVSAVELAGVLAGSDSFINRNSGDTKWMFIVSAAYKASNAYKFFYWLASLSGVLGLLSLFDVIDSSYGIVCLFGLGVGIVGETIFRRRFVANMSQGQIHEMNVNIQRAHTARNSPSKRAIANILALVFMILVALFFVYWAPMLLE